jgi:hypothetical protein
MARRTPMKTRLALAMVVLCVSTLALAAGDKEPPKWSYLEAGYMDFNPDNGLSDNGWYAGGSVGIIKMLHIFAEYDDIGDYTFWNAGFGWHGLLGDPADLYVQAQWNDLKVDSLNVSDDGYEVSAGVRWKILKWLEVKGQANWADYSEAGDEWSGEAGVLFSLLNDRLGFGADYMLTENDDRLRGYVRWSFGR